MTTNHNLINIFHQKFWSKTIFASYQKALISSTVLLAMHISWTSYKEKVYHEIPEVITPCEPISRRMQLSWTATPLWEQLHCRKLKWHKAITQFKSINMHVYNDIIMNYLLTLIWHGNEWRTQCEQLTKHYGPDCFSTHILFHN